ncbi:anaerobic sulfatase maturase [Enhygromyxa salina]|uniref:Anaerobic sulfatase-maturating enzyme n=1 Tax=Enhygromyxa salina TaxID=215803 RepID=A0A2S9YTP0_9BACT|nr:anaerobic sulfatase maturase [Enhygromyxa salina]PRQ08456.1 Anaerobic sulfatase-maturating enzyme [Enhygromyxa salina]
MAPPPDWNGGSLPLKPSAAQMQAIFKPMTDPREPARAPFHLIAKPTGAICNIKCEYCFYLDKEALYDHPKRSDFRMRDEVLERYVSEYIGAQPGGAEVNFSWQGGEPTLLGVEFFRKAVAYQRRYAAAGQVITNSLQTNGILLDDEWCVFLREAEFLVGISIDGAEALHDRYRLDLHGRGTFARVIAGLEALQRNRVEYNVLTVVQRDNGDHGAAIYRFLRDKGARFIQLIPIVEPEPEGVSSRTVGGEQWGRFLNAVWDEWLAHDVGTVFVGHFDMMLGLTLGAGSTACVHAKTCGRALAIEHNGDVYSCDHFVTPEHRVGNVTEIHLDVIVDGPAQTKFGADKYDTLPQYCLDCEYLSSCYGGCPAHRVARTPAGEPNLNHLCAGYKLFYAHTQPTLTAMAKALRAGQLARDYANFL